MSQILNDALNLFLRCRITSHPDWGPGHSFVAGREAPMESNFFWIPPLEGRSNYHIWRPLVTKQLILLGLIKFVECYGDVSRRTGVSIPQPVRRVRGKFREELHEEGCFDEEAKEDMKGKGTEEAAESEDDKDQESREEEKVSEVESKAGKGEEQVGLEQQSKGAKGHDAQDDGDEDAGKDEIRAYFVIISSLSPKLQSLHINMETAKELWEDIEECHGFKSAVSIRLLNREMRTIRLRDFACVNDFDAAFRRILSSLELGQCHVSALTTQCAFDEATRTSFPNTQTEIHRRSVVGNGTPPPLSSMMRVIRDMEMEKELELKEGHIRPDVTTTRWGRNKKLQKAPPKPKNNAGQGEGRPKRWSLCNLYNAK